ncbi:MAG: glycosyl transferase family 2 [Flavipsychrobacter sp.]|jgi:glycosyltransferase involved in cell wall biosynthesis|nr:glycosyl transferase family 2 [Flavipsychrobacter sp.]
MAAYNFPGVTLLITHFNRSSSLERLLSTLRNFGCNFDDIVVSDDGSRPEHQEKLKQIQPIYNFRLIPGKDTHGFPVNINKGQDAVTTPYTLYIQEDFVPLEGCAQHLVDALEIMKERPDIDYVRFWSFYRYPNLKPFGKGFSETYYSPWNLSHYKFFMYSDNPHLRRSNFLQKFGRYQEDIDGNISEYRMSISFMQKKGKGLFYNEYETLFEHSNSEDEPSSFDRASWRSSQSVMFKLLRWAYLRYKWLKCFKDYKFLKT